MFYALFHIRREAHHMYNVVMVEFNEEKQNERLKDLRNREEEKLAEMLAQKYSLDYIDLSTVSIDTDALRLIPEETAKKATIALFAIQEKTVGAALLSPTNSETKKTITTLLERGYIVQKYLVSKKSLERAWARYKDVSFSFETKKGVLDISNEEILSIISKVSSREDVEALIQDVLTQKKSLRISRIFEVIIAGGLALKASDIHLEPEEEAVRLRYRLDGVLTEILSFDYETYKLLLSRVKLLSGLKLNVNQSAQDGRFSIKLEDAEIQIRTSVLPGAYNESIVLRILDPKAINVAFEELGISDRLMKKLEREITKPNGMILTTGPTGSGKTTTLYAFLKKVYSHEIKIITIEDPIEYHLKGIVQTQADKKKYTFAEGLRAALRQDPDMIMVGEIRDRETASIAVNSALTGHLVFSTLHTNDAAGVFPRLIDLGVDAKIISSAINVAIAQRLLRKINKEMCVEVPIPETDKKIIQKVLDSIPGEKLNIQTEKMWVPKEGIDEVDAYHGRIGIFEAIFVDDAIENIVRENPSARDIRTAAEAQGIYTMLQDGIIKVLSGVTTLAELRRVIDLPD